MFRQRRGHQPSLVSAADRFSDPAILLVHTSKAKAQIAGPPTSSGGPTAIEQKTTLRGRVPSAAINAHHEI